MRLHDLSIGVKLIAAFMIVAGIVVLQGLLGHHSAAVSDEAIYEIGIIRLPSVQGTLSMQREMEKMRSALLALTISEAPPAQRQQQYDHFNTALQHYENAYALYEPLPQSDQEAKVWKQFVIAWNQLREENKQAIQLMQAYDQLNINNPTHLQERLQAVRGNVWKSMMTLNTVVNTGQLPDDAALQKTVLDPDFADPFASLLRDNSSLQPQLAHIQELYDQFVTAAHQLLQLTTEAANEAADHLFIDTFHPTALALIEAMRPLRAKTEEAQQLFQKSQQHIFGATTQAHDRSLALLDQIATINVNIANTTNQAAMSQSAFFNWLTLIAIFVGALLAMTLGVISSFSLTRPLNTGVAFAQSVADGDLTQHIEMQRRDEIGQLASALNDMVEHLRRIVEDVRIGAENLTNASADVSSTAQALSLGTTEQATRADQTSHRIKELNDSVQHNTDNARITNDIAKTSAQSARRGGEVVKRTVEAMKEIAGKTSLIQDIAYKTNLLALNAAIEAARAGEHGKGFSVVAAEVRKLAESSGETAEEISELANRSVSIAEEAGNLLEEMVPNIVKTAELIAHITADSDKQADGINEISGVMAHLDKAIQQNAAASEQLAATSEELNAQAEQLKQTITFFRCVEQAS
jgi:methyl-accepting chemotaxis protein